LFFHYTSEWPLPVRLIWCYHLPKRDAIFVVAKSGHGNYRRGAVEKIDPQRS